ncbi:MAG: hypothetical protein JKX72_01680 [Robiginitomaculum sp.]|nr:hypothetical protein [Robiginitomaculum sp.]
MTARFTIDEILTPLALTVIIDNKIRDPEMREFVTQAEGLIEALDDFEHMPTKNMMTWFHTNEGELIKKLKGRSKNTFILKTLTRFKGSDALIEAMYDAMLAISISDKEYHEDESELIKSAASLWGHVRPPFKVVKSK